MALEPFKISAKNLGVVNMEDFCQRCFWVKLKVSNRLPWQSFPGIFSSIDAYTKACIHAIIDSGEPNPVWMLAMSGAGNSDIVAYDTVPHWSKNIYHDDKSNINLSGVADDYLIRADGTHLIPDYKTAKFTKNADRLLPIYEMQENVYSILKGKVDGQMPDLYLVYMEPQTDKKRAPDDIVKNGFKMRFNAKVLPIETDRSIVRKALTITREIYEMKTPPPATVGAVVCDECLKFEGVLEVLGDNRELKGTDH